VKEWKTIGGTRTFSRKATLLLGISLCCKARLTSNNQTDQRLYTPKGHTEPAYLPGTLVPNATKAIAVTESFKPIVHPKCDAISPMNAVKIPITRMETTKVR